MFASLTVMALSLLAAIDGTAAPPFFGVVADKVGTGPSYRLGDRVVTAAVAREAIEKGFDDDGRKLRVTIIGPEPQRRSARLAIERHPAFAAIREEIVLRDFAPDHWAMRAGFVTSGMPTIYCQSPEGKVLHRQDDFAGGAEAVVAAIRRANEGYDPARDPDIRPRSFEGLFVVGAFLVGLGLAMVLRRR